MAQIKDSGESVAFFEALDKLTEGGWSFEGEDDAGDRRAFEIVWCAGRDWTKQQVAESLATQIDFDHAEEYGPEQATGRGQDGKESNTEAG